MNENMILVAGDIAYGTNFDPRKVFADITSGNLTSLKSQFEQYAYTTFGNIQDISVSHAMADEQRITVDNCGVGDIEITAFKTPKFSFKWLDVNNLDIVAKIFGLKSSSVTGTLVSWYTQVVAATDWQKGVFIALGNQNGDGTQITPTVTGWTLVASDYTIGMDALGRSGVTIKTSYTWSNHAITLTYSYTPYPSTLAGYKSTRDSIPMGIYKFVSCPQSFTNSTTGVTTKIRNTIYFVKFYITSELAETYINRSRTEFAGAEIEFTSAEGGYYLKVKETWTV